MKLSHCFAACVLGMSALAVNAEMRELDTQQLDAIKLSERYVDPVAVLRANPRVSTQASTQLAVQNSQVRFRDNGVDNIIPESFVNPSPIVLPDGTEIFLTLEEIYRLPTITLGDILGAVRGENDLLPSVTQAVTPDQIRDTRRALSLGTQIRF